MAGVSASLILYLNVIVIRSERIGCAELIIGLIISSLHWTDVILFKFS